MKKTMAWLLALVMIFSLFSAVSVSAEEAVVARVSLENNVSFYSSEVMGKKLNVTAYDESGNKISDLSGKKLPTQAPVPGFSILKRTAASPITVMTVQLL